MATNVKTGLVRFSYPAVFSPKSVKGSEEKYSVSIIIKKTDKEQIAAIKKAIQEAWENGRAKGYFKALLIPDEKSPLKDGDNRKNNEGEIIEDPAYEGCMYVNAYAKQRPGLVGLDPNKPITNPDEFYPGCYGRVTINFYPYGEGKKGVACGLNNIQKLKEGDRLDGRKAASSDFDDDYADSFIDGEEETYTPAKKKVVEEDDWEDL